MYMYVVYELQHVCKDVAVLLCICKLQCVDDCIVIFYFLFFIFSLSACSLWLWHCLDAVHMLDYMYLDQSRCFISFHWSITSIVCANKRFQSNNFSLSCSHFLISLYSFHFTLLFSAMTNCMKRQQQKRKSVSEAHSKSEFELLLYAKPVSFFLNLLRVSSKFSKSAK